MALRQFVVDFARPEKKNSLSAKLRKKRFFLFKKLLASVPLPLKILDVGGQATTWKKEGFCNPDQVEGITITLLNVEESQVTYPNLNTVVGDARDMKYKDGEFEVVFSNSVIEHVGNYEQQRQMAEEVKRVGQRYFLQTPNRYFPIEPHFIFPFFQFLPLAIKVWLMTHFDLGQRKKETDRQKAIQKVTSVRLLSKKELRELFPNATIAEEKFLALTKSYMLYEGWNVDF